MCHLVVFSKRVSRDFSEDNVRLSGLECPKSLLIYEDKCQAFVAVYICLCFLSPYYPPRLELFDANGDRHIVFLSLIIIIV